MGKNIFWDSYSKVNNEYSGSFIWAPHVSDSSQSSLLSKQEQQTIANLFVHFVGEQNQNVLQKTLFSSDNIALYLQDDFIAYMKQRNLSLLTVIEQKLERPITLQDIWFLKLQPEKLQESQESILWWVQLAYIDKYRSILDDKKWWFSKHEKQEFEAAIRNMQTGRVTMQVFFQTLQNLFSQWEWKSYIQSVALQSVWAVTVDDIAMVAKKYELLDEADEYKMSLTWQIGNYSFLQVALSEMVMEHAKSMKQAEKNLASEMSIEAKQFDTLWFWEFVKQWNQEALIIAKQLEQYNYSFELAPIELQKQFFMFMKNQWKLSDAYAVNKLQSVEQLHVLNNEQFDCIVDAVFDITKQTIDIPLNDGDILHINIDKKIMPTKSLIDKFFQKIWLSHNKTPSSFDEWLPLIIDISFKDVADKNIAWSTMWEKFNLSGPRALSDLIQKIGLVTWYAQQSISVDKNNEEEYRKDKFIHTISWALDGNVLSRDTWNWLQGLDDNLDEFFGDDADNDISINKSVPLFTREQVIENAQLTDDARIQKAIWLLDAYMWQWWFDKKTSWEQSLIKQAILDAHYSTVYKEFESHPDDAIWCENDRCWHEQWIIAGHRASVYCFTPEQLRKKAAILKAAWLQKNHIEILFRSWISWEKDPTIEEQLEKQLSELTNQKNEHKNLLQEAKRIYETLYRNGKDGAESLQSLERKKESFDTKIEIKKQAWSDAEMKKNDRRWWTSLTPAEQATHETYVAQLANEYADFVQQRKDVVEKITETTLSLWEEKIAIDQAKRNLDTTDEQIKELIKQQNLYKNDVNNPHYFDRNNATPEERELFYNTKKEEYKNKIKYHEWLKKQYEEKKINVTDTNSSLYKQIEQDIMNENKEILKTKNELDVLERTYKWFLKKEKEQEKKSKEEESGETEWYKELKSVWDSIQWHTWLDLIDSTQSHPQLFLRNAEKHIGKFGWSIVRCEITNVDKVTGKITLKLFGVTGKLEQNDNGVVESLEDKDFVFDAAWFKRFLDNPIWDSKVKFPWLPNNGYLSMKERWEKLKWDFNAGKYSLEPDTNKWINDFLSRVDFSSIKYQEPWSEKWAEHIAYMWREQTSDAWNPDWTEQSDWYKVDFSKNGTVKIEQPMYPDTKAIVMPYDAFLMFCADKWLKPYSQEQVDRINEKWWQKKWLSYINQGIAPWTQDEDIIRKNQKRGLFWWHWITPHAVMSQWKKIREAVKKKIDTWTKNDEEKAADVFANSWLAKKLWSVGIPVISEVIQKDFVWPALVAADKKKKAKIDEYAKEPDDNKDTTPWWAFDFIKASLFDKSEKEARSNLLQVAGYFQYCCSKWDLYPRSLAEYSGSGKWVQLLFGSTWQKVYLRWYEEQKQLLDKNPDDLDIKNRVMYGETYFITNVMSWWKNFSWAKYESWLVDDKWKPIERWTIIKQQFENIYSKSWMWWVFDMAVTGWMGQAEKVKAKKDELMKSEKYNFTLLHDEIYGCFEWKSLTQWLGYLEPMAAKMRWNEEYYNQRSVAMLYPLLSGQLQYVTDIAIKWEYMGTARKYWFPLWLWWWHAPENGRTELIKLLTLFEKRAGYTGKSIATIVKDLDNKTDKKSLESFTSALTKERWPAVWKNVLDVMASPSKLFEIESELADNKIAWQAIDSQLAKDYTDTLQLYIDTKFTDWDISSSGSDAKLDAYSLKKNIWAMSPWFIAGNLWSFKNKIFDPRVIDNVPWLWKELTKELKTYIDKPSLTERETSFLMNKFYGIVGQWARLQWSTEEELLYAIYSPKTIKFQPTVGKKWWWSDAGEPFPANMLEKFIMKWIDGKSMEWNNLPKEVRDNLAKWIELFQKDDFQSKLSSVVAQGKVKMFADQKDIQKKINNERDVSGVSLKDQAQEWFKSPRRYGNKDRKWYNQQFGYADYIDDDEDEEDY